MNAKMRWAIIFCLLFGHGGKPARASLAGKTTEEVQVKTSLEEISGYEDSVLLKGESEQGQLEPLKRQIRQHPVVWALLLAPGIITGLHELYDWIKGDPTEESVQMAKEESSHMIEKLERAFKGHIKTLKDEIKLLSGQVDNNRATLLIYGQANNACLKENQRLTEALEKIRAAQAIKKP